MPIAPTLLDPVPTAAPPGRVDAWLAEVSADERLVHHLREPARAARTEPLTGPPLHPAVAHLLPPGGLWSHQAEALAHVRAGRSVVVATPTASGKSLVYQLPIAEAACAPLRPATSLLLYPTKALAEDQLRSFLDLGVDRLVAATYDGDSGPDERRWVREHANALLTNPEMLHHGVLPNHRRWSTFLGRLRYVVVDELHVLRGVFGSHVAHLLRRLARQAHRYGADPSFVFSSATVGEPARLAAELCGRQVVVVVDDGSPRGERHLLLWDPEALPPDRRRSSATESAELAASLARAGLRTLVFCRSRRSTEVVADRIRARLDPVDADRVRAYRSGYLAEERREIEEDLAGGRLDVVVATSALELGVDISGLDAVVLNGFPGTVASMWQQIGRAGRHGGAAVSVLVAGDDQLDRWVVRHPTEALTRPPERAVTNPANPQVVDAELACAAHELPLAPEDDRYWGAVVDDAVLRGVHDGWLALRRRGPYHVRAVWDGDGWPSSAVGLRSSSRGEHRIVGPDDEVIGTLDDARLHQQAHTGAVYLHQGRAWRVVAHDPERRSVHVEPDPGDTSTHARSHTSVEVLHTDDVRAVGRSRLAIGWVRVTHQVTGYQVRDLHGRIVEQVPLDLPPSHLVTRAVRYEVPPEVVRDAGLDAAAVGPALHAVEHAAIGILPLFAICDRWDVGGLSTDHLEAAAGPAFLVYDAYQGGIGIAELAWDAADRHLHTTLDVIAGCACDDGCPSCIQSPKCGNWNDHLDKAAALALLRVVLPT